MRLIVLLFLATAGCGAMLRASAGPTLALDGRPGIELGAEVATHWLGTEIAGAPIGVRVQGVALGAELAGFVGLAFGNTALPDFYGVGPTAREEDTHGYSGHLAGAFGANSDGTTGIRGAAAVGHGSGHAITSRRVRYVEHGFEAAWQGNFEVANHDWRSVGNRITAAMYFQWTWLPANNFELPDIGPQKH